MKPGRMAGRWRMAPANFPTRPCCKARTVMFIWCTLTAGNISSTPVLMKHECAGQLTVNPEINCMAIRPANVTNLKPLLAAAERGGYAVGSFAPRATAMIRPVLEAGQSLQSPLIVQISHRELLRHEITPAQFAEAFYQHVAALNITVPVTLHLDHTKSLPPIQEAIAAGFTSVMIDASEKPLEENIAATCEVVAYAKPLGVSVEAELGRIGTTDYVETEEDEE